MIDSISDIDIGLVNYFLVFVEILVFLALFSFLSGQVYTEQTGEIGVHFSPEPHSE